jgi:hypothetical protein
MIRCFVERPRSVREMLANAAARVWPSLKHIVAIRREGGGAEIDPLSSVLIVRLVRFWFGPRRFRAF